MMEKGRCWMWFRHSMFMVLCFVLWILLLIQIIKKGDEEEASLKTACSQLATREHAPIGLDADYEDQGGLFIHLPQKSMYGWPFFDPSLRQDNPHLIQYLKKAVLLPPSKKSYTSSNPLLKTGYSQFGKVEAETLPLVFGNMRNGTFFEAKGLLDGEWTSTTLHMERLLGWQGLVSEMGPSHGHESLSKNRKAWFAPTCLSPKPYAIMAIYKSSTNSNVDAAVSIRNDAHAEILTNDIKNNLVSKTVPCFPLYSLLLATNLTTLDFCSLDVEGTELKVLRTLPWDKVDIKVIFLVLMHTTEGLLLAVHEFLSAVNYRRIRMQESLRGITYVRRDWANARMIKV